MNRRTNADLVGLLQRSADAPAPPVDPVFAAQLERRLRTVDLTVAPRTARGLRRGASAGVVVALALAGAAAAAAGVVTLRANDDSVTTTSMVHASTSSAPAAILPVATAVETTLATPSTALPAVVTLAPATTATPPITAPVVESTVAPATTVPEPATTSTEVRVAATLTLSCITDGAAVTCSWSAGPDGTTQYALLRSEPGGTAGRAFVVDASATNYTDASAVPGTTYNYLVHALDANKQSLGHSDHIAVPCC